MFTTCKLVAAVAVCGAVLTALGVQQLIAGSSDCATAGCSKGCKKASYWCIGSSSGRSYAETIAHDSYCSKTIDGGSLKTLKVVAYDVYSSCSQDCPDDSLCTGAPTNKTSSNSEQVALDCDNPA